MVTPRDTTGELARSGSGRSLDHGSVFVGDLEIEGLLGKGGMGAVYAARQISTGRRRALKIMQSRFAGDDGYRKRFVQEATVGSSIASDHIVQGMAAGVDAET